MMVSVEDAFPYQSRSNEIANASTHGMGLLLSIVGAAVLVSSARTRGSLTVVGLVVYCLSLAAVYAFSTLSHTVQTSQAKQLLRAWDQGAIYLLISGTYTPLVIRYLPESQMWVTLVVIWAAAVAGCYAKIASHHRVNSMTTWSYILLGWLPAMAFIGNRPPTACFVWMALGGVSYSVGTVFLKLDQRMNYCHAIWHFWVMAGSACHYYAIYRFAAA